MITGIAKRGLFDRDEPSGGETDLILSIHRNGPTKTVTVAHHLHLPRFQCMHSSNRLNVLLATEEVVDVPAAVRERRRVGRLH